MAHQITGEQVGVVLPQVAFEPVHLAGHAGEEHRRPLLQQRLDLGKAAAQIALDVLGAPHGGQLVHRAGAHVAGGHVLVQRRAEHRAPLLQHMAGQQGEEAARGAGCPLGLVAVPDRVGRRRGGAGHRGVEDGAGMLAPAAQDAPLPNDGPQEAFMVGLHGNGVHRTNRRAGGAAGAVLRPAQHRTGGGLGLRLLRGQGGALDGGPQIGQGVGPGGRQLLVHRAVVYGGVHRGGGVQAQDAVGTAQPGEQAVDAGEGGLRPLPGGHGGEEVLLELEGEGRPVEGVGHHGGGVPEQAQKLPGAGVKDQLGRPVDLPPRPRELHDGPAGARRQGQSVGGRLAGVGDKVAQDIGPLPFGGRSQLSPVLAGEEEGGIQHHPGVPPGSLPQQNRPPLFPHGQGGEGSQKAAQLLGLVLRQLRHAQAGGVGDAAALPDEAQQEGGVKLLVLEDIGVPDLVAARHIHVVGGRVGPELLEGGVPLGGEGHLLGHKGLEAPEAALERPVVEGGVGIGGHAAHAAALFEKLVGAGGVGQAVVDDLAVVPQGLDGPHGGKCLELCPVVVGEMKGDESGAHGAHS